MAEINTKGFHIVSKGDPSAGIFRAEWELSGSFSFDGKEDLEQFRTKLKEAFEYISDDAYVETFEERQSNG
jgi:hypothetical protein